jgi:hypothetical protein
MRTKGGEEGGIHSIEVCLLFIFVVLFQSISVSAK